MATKVCLHSFTMGDVEDPYLYAGFPLHEWQQTDHGKWCMEHAIEPPTFYCHADQDCYGYRVDVIGELSDQDLTFFNLKWGNFENKRRRV